MILPRHEWSPAQTLAVAALIVNPATNGGTATGASAEQVAPHIPDAPAWAVFDGARCVFVVGLNPYDPSIPRGILHVAGTREYPDAWRLVASFLDALRGVEVMTLTDSPGLARLAMKAGMSPIGVQDGYLLLGR